MKKRIIILVEGHTEEEFIKKTLAPYLQNCGIFDIRPIKSSTSSTQKGGIVSYQKFKNNISRILNEDHEVFVTTLIDFFGIPNSFPNYDKAQIFNLNIDKVKSLEVSIDADINNDRFFSYIQLHEMEALLFVQMDGFTSNLNLKSTQLEDLQEIFKDYPNPENINSRPDKAPSKRLKKIIPDYQKVVFGNIIMESNGIQMILDKCPRFAN